MLEEIFLIFLGMALGISFFLILPSLINRRKIKEESYYKDDETYVVDIKDNQEPIYLDTTINPPKLIKIENG